MSLWKDFNAIKKKKVLNYFLDGETKSLLYYSSQQCKYFWVKNVFKMGFES